MIYDNILVEVRWINSQTQEQEWVVGELRPEGGGVKWYPLADNPDPWYWPCWWSNMNPSNVRLKATPRQFDSRFEFSESDRRQMELFPIWGTQE